MRPFDGNSAVLRYVVELSENSECGFRGLGLRPSPLRSAARCRREPPANRPWAGKVGEGSRGAEERGGELDLGWARGGGGRGRTAGGLEKHHPSLCGATWPSLGPHPQPFHSPIVCLSFQRFVYSSFLKNIYILLVFYREEERGIVRNIDERETSISCLLLTPHWECACNQDTCP